ncbi:MAG: hypothetical protein IT238_07100 [Bacteroidia bacterium]|nr:hypothetical protein [Bacteroidia bacterium]MCZ2247504.1 hypothetical protein [Bacteroidia bacterium]
MLNKPINLRKITMILMVMIFGLSGTHLFAQANKVNSEPEKKQVPTSTRKTATMSDQAPKEAQKSEADLKRQQAIQERMSKSANETKKQNIEKEQAEKMTVKSNAPSTSAVNSVGTISKVNNNQTATNNENVKAEWEKKKAKLVADLKARGASDEDINNKVATLEKQMNINNNSNK